MHVLIQGIYSGKTKSLRGRVNRDFFQDPGFSFRQAGQHVPASLWNQMRRKNREKIH